MLPASLPPAFERTCRVQRQLLFNSYTVFRALHYFMFEPFLPTVGSGIGRNDHGLI